jgi:YVTN family beta-propeller protein
MIGQSRENDRMSCHRDAGTNSIPRRDKAWRDSTRRAGGDNGRRGRSLYHVTGPDPFRHTEVTMRTLTAGLLFLFAGAMLAAGPESYHLLKTVTVPGDGSWDYVAVDATGRRVYVSHATKVDVLDADSYAVVGQVTDTAGVHGIAIASKFNRGFTTNGRANTVTVFDLKTLKPLATVPTGKNPDSIIDDPATGRVFAFNGGSANVTVIDAAEARVVNTVELGGQPEFAAADGAGHVFVNLEDKEEVLKLDSRDLKVLERWPIAPAKTPVSMAIDAKNHRLFVGCRSKSLLVLDTETGKVVATVPIGERVDASAFDPEAKLVFSSCGDGTVSVVRQDSPDKYTAVGTIKTRTGSKTMALDPKTHRLFVPAAEFKPPTGGRGRPTIVPGSFVVLVYGP